MIYLSNFIGHIRDTIDNSDRFFTRFLAFILALVMFVPLELTSLIDISTDDSENVSYASLDGTAWGGNLTQGYNGTGQSVTTGKVGTSGIVEQPASFYVSFVDLEGPFTKENEVQVIEDVFGYTYSRSEVSYLLTSQNAETTYGLVSQQRGIGVKWENEQITEIPHVGVNVVGYISQSAQRLNGNNNLNLYGGNDRKGLVFYKAIYDALKNNPSAFYSSGWETMLIEGAGTYQEAINAIWEKILGNHTGTSVGALEYTTYSDIAGLFYEFSGIDTENGDPEEILKNQARLLDFLFQLCILCPDASTRLEIKDRIGRIMSGEFYEEPFVVVIQPAIGFWFNSRGDAYFATTFDVYNAMIGLSPAYQLDSKELKAKIISTHGADASREKFLFNSGGDTPSNANGNGIMEQAEIFDMAAFYSKVRRTDHIASMKDGLYNASYCLHRYLPRTATHTPVYMPTYNGAMTHRQFVLAQNSYNGQWFYGEMVFTFNVAPGSKEPPFGLMTAEPHDVILNSTITTIEGKGQTDDPNTMIPIGQMEGFTHNPTVKIEPNVVSDEQSLAQWNELLTLLDASIKNGTSDGIFNIEYTITRSINDAGKLPAGSILNQTKNNKGETVPYSFSLKSEWESTLPDFSTPSIKWDTSSGSNMTTQQMTFEEFKSAIENNSIVLQFQDHIDSNRVYKYKQESIFLFYHWVIHIKFTLDGEEQDLEYQSDYDPDAWASYIIKVNKLTKKWLIDPIYYYSEPEDYAELKNYGPGSNMNGTLVEEYEVMAGVPSTKQLYYAAGGSEFIVDLAMIYVPEETAIRSYTSHFKGVKCEFYLSDTFPALNATNSNNHKDVNSQPDSRSGPSTVGKYDYIGFIPEGASSYTVNIPEHSGDVTITATWTGTIANRTPFPGWDPQYKADTYAISGSCPSMTITGSEATLQELKDPQTSWDPSNYNRALQQVKAWVDKYEATNDDYTAKSVSSTDGYLHPDEATRIWKIGNA